jgi:hypothetical protein
MTIENRDDVVRRVEQYYENSANKGKPYSGKERQAAMDFAMKRCKIDRATANVLLKRIAKSVRGEIIMPEYTNKDSTANRKGDNVKQLVKAENERNAPQKKERKQNDQTANPAKYRKESREYRAANPDYVEKSKKRRLELGTKKRHANEESLRQAAKAVRDLGKKVTPDDLLKQVYKARPKTRNAQPLLDDRFTIFHVTHVAPHELDPAGLLVPFDSNLENRKKKKKLTPAQLMSVEQVWGTPVSLANALHGFRNLHGGSKVNLEKDLHVYAVTESHPQYETFYQHTVNGNNAPKHAEHFVWSLEKIAVGETDPGVVVLRIPWTSDGKPEPDLVNLEVMYCNPGE